MNILLVCTGNTCRSVMAEALIDDAVDRSRKLGAHIKTDSAGTFAAEDLEATDFAVKVLEEMNVDVGRHRSKQIDEELVEWADMILTVPRKGRLKLLRLRTVPPFSVPLIRPLWPPPGPAM